MYEGPQTIAAIVMESVTGTNGILIPPKVLLTLFTTLILTIISGILGGCSCSV